jgi:hypothetical protein
LSRLAAAAELDPGKVVAVDAAPVAAVAVVAALKEVAVAALVEAPREAEAVLGEVSREAAALLEEAMREAAAAVAVEALLALPSTRRTSQAWAVNKLSTGARVIVPISWKTREENDSPLLLQDVSETFLFNTKVLAIIPK